MAEGENAVNFAVRHGRLRTLTALLDFGARVRGGAPTGRCPTYNQFQATPLLLAHGADVNALMQVAGHSTPLLEAIGSGNHKMVT